MSKGTKLAGRLAEITAEIEVLNADLVEAERASEEELRKLSAAVVLHEISETAAMKRRAKILAEVEKKREKLKQLREAIPALDERITHEAEERHRAEIRQAGNKLAAALRARHGASRALARALRDMELAVNEVERHRHLVDEAHDAYAALLPESFTWPEGAPVDEAWEAADELLAFLADGPITPIATTQAALAEGRAIRGRQDAEQLRDFARNPSEARLALLPERLHTKAKKIAQAYDEKYAEQQRKVKEREESRAAARL
ncbi:MAG: hypothetical protein M3364_03500 [Actinomycetota bacterium]|nr:hypothetical protein [Actinomycetota bacterium]